MKIFFYEVNDTDASVLSQGLPGHQLVFYPGKLEAEHVAVNDAEVLSVFVGSIVNKAVLNKFPNLRLVTIRATGYDNVDIAACKEKGIQVCNVPDYGADTVAEFTFALMLALSRKVLPAVERVKDLGQFNQGGLCGMDLFGKKLGVVGTGRIGSRVAKIGLGFGMQVFAYDPFPNNDLKDSGGVSYVSFDELVKNADVISLHLPYTAESHHLFSKKIFDLMKMGSLLVNTARGALVDTKSLLAAIASEKLGGAALDVLEYEGFVRDEIDLLVGGHANEQEVQTALADHALARFPNVLLTPHIAYYTIEAVRRILTTTVSNIQAFENGQKQNLV